MTRGAIVLAIAVAAGSATVPRGAVGEACPDAARWPHWQRYRDAFLQADGRVIDRTGGDRTTSEGQAYALFHALVANDRAAFDAVLRWTEQNLARGDLAAHLPAWSWGRARDGRWGVLDDNAASDADLWMGYALVEAARLWREPRYDAIGRRVLANVVSAEVVSLPGLGPMLLPAPRGFALGGRRGWRLNPSYLPPEVLARLVSADVPGPWAAVATGTARMLRETASRGAVPDWVLYRERGGFGTDPVSGPRGGYEAIRVYLWLGMQRDALHGSPGGAWTVGRPVALLEALTLRGKLPERIDTRTLRGSGEAPVGFYAALLPLARVGSDERAVRRIEEVLRAASRDGLYGTPPAYYDQNLALFGLGFAEGRFRFEADGRLTPAWEVPCAARR